MRRGVININIHTHAVGVEWLRGGGLSGEGGGDDCVPRGGPTAPLTLDSWSMPDDSGDPCGQWIVFHGEAIEKDEALKYINNWDAIAAKRILLGEECKGCRKTAGTGLQCFRECSFLSGI